MWDKSHKDMQDLYIGNYKTLLREIKHFNKWRDMLCSCVGKLNIA
jgi:hypothetical protein